MVGEVLLLRPHLVVVVVQTIRNHPISAVEGNYLLILVVVVAAVAVDILLVTLDGVNVHVVFAETLRAP